MWEERTYDLIARDRVESLERKHKIPREGNGNDGS
jgi:hypothetical protein